MPRRKRCESAGRKEPLTFIESPLHIPHGIPSPVFAADWPCTADVVPIDGATAYWVSPQFHNPPHPSRVTRSRRQKNSSEDTAISSKAKTKKLDKLVPLKFLGDKSPSPEMIRKTKTHRKDIEVSENQDKRSRESKTKLKSSKPSVKSPHTSENDIEGITPVRRTSRRLMDLSNKKSKAKTALVDDVFGIEATDAFKRLQEHQAATSEGDELPEDFTAIKSTRKRKGKKHKKLNLSEVDLDLTLPENDNVRSSSNSNSPVFGTQHLPGEAKKGTRKRRLFSVSETDQMLQDDSNENQTIEELSNVSESIIPPEIDTPNIREVIRHLQPPLSARCPNVSRSGHKTVKSHRSMRLKGLLANTPARMGTPKKVLAYDTPESEYGMPVRQRRLRHWRSLCT